MAWAEFLAFAGVGLLAQLVDGALGMAYGLVSSSVLLSLGLPPVVASASVHTAEIATTAASGAAHAWFGNVERKLLFQLALPGVLGGVLGALFLANIPAAAIAPFVNGYLIILGLVVLARASGYPFVRGRMRHPSPLGFIAGLLDAIGGGGWGSIATSTLIARGGAARMVIGTVNAAECMVTVAVSVTLIAHIGIHHWTVVLGLLAGGVIAAPLAAWLVKHLPERIVLVAVGLLIVVLGGFRLLH
ncbi:MAG TPA: sulfite exporter TauE/SafE family protein [Rhodanobacteraceae bacterium]